MKQVILALSALAIAVFAFVAVPMQSTSAQTDVTPTVFATSTGPVSDLQGSIWACESGASISLDGFIVSGYSIYYQLFSGSTSGTALTSLRQISATGNVSVDEFVNYNSGSTLPAGSTLAARILVAVTGNSNNIDFEFNLSDVQDGCGSNATANTGSATVSTDTGSNAATVTTVDVNRLNLFAPNGVTLNSNLAPEATVVVGARLSDNYRSNTPGLIYAACENFALALPGIVYDADNVTVYWSWYARTRQQVEDHIANAIYSVRVNTALLQGVQRSEVQQRGRNYWVFYQVDLGNLQPGHYEVEYRVEWAQPITDGYDDFGPGTSNVRDAGNCNFDVARNPNNLSIDYNNAFIPSVGPVHNLFPDY